MLSLHTNTLCASVAINHLKCFYFPLVFRSLFSHIDRAYPLGFRKLPLPHTLFLLHKFFAMLFISPHILRLIDLALDEDQIGFDFTSQAFFANASSRAYFLAKSDLTAAALQIVPAVFHRVDPALHVDLLHQDGESIETGTILARAHGPTVSLLRAERVALNFLQRACGIATKTADFVRALDNPNIRIADTRKTLPGYRELDKYAVRCGGDFNHRFALSGGIMLKDNHIAAAGGDVARAVEMVRQLAPHTLRVEVEVENLEQIAPALESGAEIIMLDNMSTPMMQEAAARIRAFDPRVTIEVSGNVTLDRLPELGSLDVDVISTGAITHSITAADISMKFEKD